MDTVLSLVDRRIGDRALSYQHAAREIGVSVGSLRHHLSGGYVRSDSLAKYRAWLEGEPVTAQQRRPRAAEAPIGSVLSPEPDRPTLANLRVAEVPDDPPTHLVVDLFSGVGGLTLGFDLFGRQQAFRTVLALDIEEPVVACYNANRSWHRRPVCDQVDLADFIKEAEVLAFYLDRTADVIGDRELRDELETLPFMGLARFKAAIAGLDRGFLERLSRLREDPKSRRAIGLVSAHSWRQTSVTGFHQALALPLPSERALPRPLVWASSPSPKLDGSDQAMEPDLREWLSGAQRSAMEAWDLEIEKLRSKTTTRGRGQLASSAARIGEFLQLLEAPVGQAIRELWIDWRAARQALRAAMFSSDSALVRLRSSYSAERRVSVILGGPPCQGFSRIGRGKIRSLRENGVHVQSDSEAGDIRNRLLEAYVLFVSALAPTVFLFENVRHFQAKVRTPEGTFDATEVLAEAIGDLMRDGVGYQVASKVVDASRSMVPQTRERYFMIGVRSDVVQRSGMHDIAEWVLSLPEHEPVPLIRALDGLPAPLEVDTLRGPERLGTAVDITHERASGDDAAGKYIRWIRQLPSGGADAAGSVDGHVIRPPRSDDGSFFELLGPGKRWMDYRSDDSETLRDLSNLLTQVRAAMEALNDSGPSHPALRRLAEIDRSVLERLIEAADGSLPIRLLLEGIEPRPGELRHHLITPEYLAKREGNHGDWLARLPPDRPSKTIVSHMGKDTYAYVHPFQPRTLSVREAARIQSFPDWFSFRSLGFVDAMRAIGNAVPPLLSLQLAERVAQVLWIGASVGEDAAHAPEAPASVPPMLVPASA